MSSPDKIDRIWYFDFLRITACVFVIVFHAVSMRMYITGTGSSRWMFLNAFNSLSHWAVPVFVMISGALFLNPAKPFRFRVILKKKLPRFIIAFMFWSAVYAVIDYLQGVRLRHVALHFISGGVHLWFLYMIAGLYLIVPLLKRIVSSEKATKYFLLLWFLCSILLDSCKPLVSYLAPRYSGWLDTVTNSIDLQFVCGYTGYFVLGYYLHHFELSKKTRSWVYVFGGCGAAVTFFTTLLFSKKSSALVDFYHSYFAFGVFLEAVAVFLLFKHHSPETINDKAQKIVLTLSNCSFGIYLVHYLFVRYNAQIFRFDLLSLHPLLAVPVLTLIVFVCSFIISYILNKIPVVKKYLV